LESTEKKTIRSFLNEYAKYEAQGGTIKLERLMRPTVEKLVSRQRLGKDTMEQTLQRMVRPSSKTAAYTLLQGVGCSEVGNYVDIESLWDFVTRFEEAVQECADLAPAEELLVKLFTAQLKPKTLQIAVDISMPTNLEQAITTCLQEANEFKQAEEKLQLPNGGKGKGPPITSQGIGVKTPPKHSSPTCYGCGEVGHIRPNCPTKGSQAKAWNRKNGRLEKVNAVFTEQKLPEVDILVGCLDGNVQLKALLDTGSDVSLISKRAEEQLLKKRLIIRKIKQKTLQAAGGTDFVVDREVELRIFKKLSNREIATTLKCFVAPCSTDILIGFHDLKNTGLKDLLTKNLEAEIELGEEKQKQPWKNPGSRFSLGL
jgi:hypothetical protein